MISTVCVHGVNVHFPCPIAPKATLKEINDPDAGCPIYWYTNKSPETLITVGNDMDLLPYGYQILLVEKNDQSWDAFKKSDIALSIKEQGVDTQSLQHVFPQAISIEPVVKEDILTYEVLVKEKCTLCYSAFRTESRYVVFTFKQVGSS